MFREGDIVGIPLPDGRTAIAWILHISTYFKNAVGFVVFGPQGRATDAVICDETTGKPQSFRVFGPLYTNLDACTENGWKVFDHRPITDAKRQWTKRLVGDDVYIADERLGSVTELGQSGLRPMFMYDMPGVHRQIARAFPEEM